MFSNTPDSQPSSHHHQDEISEASGARAELLASVIPCSRSSHHPLALTIDTPNLEIVAAALRDCGHAVPAEVLAELVSALRQESVIVPLILVDHGIEESNVEVSDYYRIALNEGGTVVRSREIAIHFFDENEEEESVLSGLDSWKPQSLLADTKLVLRAHPSAAEKFELLLQFDNEAYRGESCERRWEAVSTFAQYLDEEALPAQFPGIVNSGENPEQPRLKAENLEIELQSVAALAAELQEDKRPAVECATEVELKPEDVWQQKGVGIKDLKPDQLREILRTCGLKQIETHVCTHLMNAVKFGMPLEAKYFSFITRHFPITLLQERRVHFEGAGAYREDFEVQWETEELCTLGGLQIQFTANESGNSAQGHVQKIAGHFTWYAPNDLPRGARKRIDALLTR